jgi:hypothetical protein
MIFKDSNDKQAFLDAVFEEEHVSGKHLFVKRQPLMVNSFIKSFRKSMKTKHAWDRHKFKFLVAIRKWHDSIKGRRFHRKLTRFLLTRPMLDRSGLLTGDAKEVLREMKKQLATSIFSGSLSEMRDKSDVLAIIKELI